MQAGRRAGQRSQLGKDRGNVDRPWRSDRSDIHGRNLANRLWQRPSWPPHEEFRHGRHPGERYVKRRERLQRKLARAQRGSNRRHRVKASLARLKARETDRRKDWVEKTSTRLARRFDVIGVEDLNIRGMTASAKGTVAQPGRNVRAKAGLNRGILNSGWGALAQRLEHKAPGRVVKVNPAYTSQRCSACGTVDREARESPARYRCRACGHTGNADVNAAINIATAAGRAVAAREGPRVAGPVHREPQHGLLLPV
ncbi:RNA-guided endonuclease InsQ/TnpB family protein [Streptomyces sp. 2A115]|uniref:RNA-guided endonuclease InsQ/TnpB family protein n=1 Tax=Streptomyces sp. 2A115 TaxID=3457439 RepID=UPI003FD1335B